ncbi:MAG: ATP-grasp domain-containing protein [Bacteroidetes bacterium]|nr:ATP-grasp domain-containing protein [Bacteroidota bacterium]
MGKRIMKIGITGLNNVDSPGPGVPVIRAIKDKYKSNCTIIGLIYDSLEPGAYMENVAEKSYMIPYPSSGLDSLLIRLKKIHEIEKFDIIIPTLDSELYGFVKLTPKLEEMGIKTFLPTLDQLNFRAKDKLYDFFKNSGIRVPKNILITSPEDFKKFEDEFEYPVVIKGIFYDAYIVKNEDEAISAFNKMRFKWGVPIIVQEFVKGDEYNVAALGDGTGAMVGGVPMKKLTITDKGKAWAGITIADPDLKELAEKIMDKLKWRSGIELEFVKEEKSNEYYLLEVNPRFPAWVYLAVAAGQNLPAALIDLMNGKEVKKFTEYEIGKIFIRYSWDLITDIKKFEEITVKGVLSNG